MSKFNRVNFVGALVFLAFSAPSFADRNASKVIVVNKSSWAIHEMYISPTNDTEWGEDQLGKHAIETGEQFTLTGVPCGKWDVQVVDEDGDRCVVENVGLCGETDKWVITDKDLLACQAASE